MFGKLKDRLKSWTKGLSKKSEESVEEIIQEVEETELEKAPKQEETKKAKKEKKSEKAQNQAKKAKTKVKEGIVPEIPEIEPPEYEEKETIPELIETPLKYNEGRQIYEPDTEKIKEIEEELIEKKETPKKSILGKFTSKINKVKISEKDFWKYAEDLEIILLENNVAFEVSEKIIEQLKERIVDKEFLKKEMEFQINETLKDIIYELLVEPFNVIKNIKLYRGKEQKKPYIILFCGINGTGKTTTIAKISDLLSRNNLTSVLAAGDTFRAASIEQLKKHSEVLGTKVIAHEYGSDPASVGFDAIKYAEKNEIDVVLIDTAGRMHTEKNLMAQIEKVTRVCKPDLKIFVGESITGNDIIEQVKEFDKSVKIDGIILTKADIDEKGGTALSVGATTGKPILYLGTGQRLDDLIPFNRTDFINSLGLE